MRARGRVPPRRCEEAPDRPLHELRIDVRLSKSHGGHRSVCCSGPNGRVHVVATPEVIRAFDKLPDYEPIGLDLRKLLPRGRTLLEVGCHAGVLLDRFRGQGWSVSGVEPDGRAANFARSHYGLDVKASTLEDAG